jgi:DNA-binding NarL/FixJ family response regulator
MKDELNLIGSCRSSSLRLDPTLTGEEAIILRALAGGQTAKQICKELRMRAVTFQRIMRDMMDKTGTADNISLILWATRQMRGVDQRVDRPERYARPA